MTSHNVIAYAFQLASQHPRIQTFAFFLTALSERRHDVLFRDDKITKNSVILIQTPNPAEVILTPTPIQLIVTSVKVIPTPRENFDSFTIMRIDKDWSKIFS